MVVYEKKYIWQHEMNNQNICLTNNTTQLYFRMGRPELHGIFSIMPKDDSDIDGFSNRKWVSAMCKVRNL